jgi:hypothetical protein
MDNNDREVERALDWIQESRTQREALAANFRGKGLFEDIPDSSSGFTSSADFTNWKAGGDSGFNPFRYNGSPWNQ